MPQQTRSQPALSEQEITRRLLQIYTVLGVFDEDDEQRQPAKENDRPAIASKQQAEQSS